jgi:hypothetical protein
VHNRHIRRPAYADTTVDTFDKPRRAREPPDNIADQTHHSPDKPCHLFDR